MKEIRIGTGKTKKLYLGATPVKEAWLGNVKVYPAVQILIVNVIVSDIPAGGGSINSCTIVYLQNGEQKQKKYSFNSKNIVSADSLGTTIKDRTKIATKNVYIIADDEDETIYMGKPLDVWEVTLMSFDIYLEANKVKSESFYAPTFDLGTIADIPAKGGTSAVPTISNVLQKKKLTYTSNATKDEAVVVSSYTAYYGKATDPTSENSSSCQHTANSLGIIIQNNRSYIGLSYVRIKANDVYSASKNASVYQSANVITKYDKPTGLSITCSDVPASGGSVTTGTVSGTCKQKRYYTSEASDEVTVTYSGSWTGGAVNIASLGTTEKARSIVGNDLVYIYTANKVSNTATCKVYQAANTITNADYNGSNGSYWAKLEAISGLSAAGGSTELKGSAGHTYTYYKLWTSGSTTGPFTTPKDDAVKFDLQNVSTHQFGSSTLNAFGITNSKYLYHDNMTTRVATDTCRVRAINSSSTSTYDYKDLSISNKVEKTDSTGVYSDITLTASSDSISASGGSATFTTKCSWTETKKYTYTSGSTSSTTLDPVDVSNAVQLKFADGGNGNNRFTLSGRTVSHSSMGTNATTDTVKITAYISDKTKEWTKSVTNSVEKTETSDDNYSVSITLNSGGNTLSAAGGELNYTTSASHRHGTRNVYTSGDKTAYSYSTVTDNAKVTIDSGSDVGIIGTTGKFVHYNMTTNVRTDKIRLKATNGTATAYLPSSTTTYDIENKVTSEGWAYDKPTLTLTNNLTASGGTVSISIGNCYKTKTTKYTSGSSVTGNKVASAATDYVWNIKSNGNARFGIYNNNKANNVITHSSMTTNATTDTVVVIATNGNVNSDDKSASVTNAYVTEGWTGSASGGTISAPTAYAVGGETKTVSNGSGASASTLQYYYTYTAGTFKYNPSGPVYSWYTSNTNFSLTSSNAASLNVKAASYIHNTGTRTSTITRRATFTYGSKTTYVDATCTVTQNGDSTYLASTTQINGSYEYQNESGSASVSGDIGANGSARTVSGSYSYQFRWKYQNKYVYNWNSDKAYASESTSSWLYDSWTTGSVHNKTYSISGSSNGASVNSTGQVTAYSLGTTSASRTKRGTVTVTFYLTGKNATKSVDVYQAANTYSTTANVTDITASCNSSSLSNNGGTVTINFYGTTTPTYTYTSGSTSTGTSSYNLNVSAYSNANVTKSNDNIGFTQQAKTNSSGVVFSYPKNSTYDKKTGTLIAKWDGKAIDMFTFVLAGQSAYYKLEVQSIKTSFTYSDLNNSNYHLETPTVTYTLKNTGTLTISGLTYAALYWRYTSSSLPTLIAASNITFSSTLVSSGNTVTMTLKLPTIDKNANIIYILGGISGNYGVSCSLECTFLTRLALWEGINDGYQLTNQLTLCRDANTLNRAATTMFIPVENFYMKCTSNLRIYASYYGEYNGNIINLNPDNSSKRGSGWVSELSAATILNTNPNTKYIRLEFSRTDYNSTYTLNGYTRKYTMTDSLRGTNTMRGQNYTYTNIYQMFVGIPVVKPYKFYGTSSTLDDAGTAIDLVKTPWLNYADYGALANNNTTKWTQTNTHGIRYGWWFNDSSGAFESAGSSASVRCASPYFIPIRNLNISVVGLMCTVYLYDRKRRYIGRCANWNEYTNAVNWTSKGLNESSIKTQISKTNGILSATGINKNDAYYVRISFRRTNDGSFSSLSTLENNFINKTTYYINSINALYMFVNWKSPSLGTNSYLKETVTPS